MQRSEEVSYVGGWVREEKEEEERKEEKGDEE